MTIKTTTWHPDTCRCGATYTWDDAVDPLTRVHTFQRILETCPAHISLSGVELYDTMVDENARKNITFNIVSVARVDLNPDVMIFSYTGTGKDRVLQASFPSDNLSTAEKATLQAAANVQFGPGKVVVT